MRCRLGYGILLGGLFMFFGFRKIDGVQIKSGYYEDAAVELKSWAGDMLQEDFSLLDLKTMLENGMHFTVCTMITRIINVKRQFLKFNRSFLSFWAGGACLILKTANLMSGSECKGLVNVYLDTVLYLINHVNDIRTVCPILFQSYFCKHVPKPHYSISINSDVPKPKRESQFKENETTPLRFLQITDVHFDPTYKPGSNAVCKEFLCCMPSSGKAKKRKNQAGYWTDYRECDVPDYLVKDTFDHISKNDKFDYIYFTGDVIYHKLWATSKATVLTDLHHFWKMFKDAFSGYTVFPVLGNHDVHPGSMFPPEYMNNEGEFSVQWLFNATAEIWKDFLPDKALETVRKGGYYSVSPTKGFRVIAINSNIAFYFNFWLVLDDQDPYGQLQWLASELQLAEDNNEVVHILSHVPAGTEMVNSWAEQLCLIIRRYHNVIGGIFNGHTHSDEFNMYYSSDGKPISVAYNGGSLTPYSDVNPNYRIYSADPTTFEIIDFETYMMNLTEANLNWKQRPRWRQLYSLKSEYDLSDASPESMHLLTTRMIWDVALRELYFKNSVRYGTPSLAKGCDKKCHTTLMCNIVNTVNSDTSHCRQLQKQMNY